MALMRVESTNTRNCSTRSSPPSSPAKVCSAKARHFNASSTVGPYNLRSFRKAARRSSTQACRAGSASRSLRYPAICAPASPSNTLTCRSCDRISPNDASIVASRSIAFKAFDTSPTTPSLFSLPTKVSCANVRSSRSAPAFDNLAACRSRASSSPNSGFTAVICSRPSRNCAASRSRSAR
ncbi:unannotated protein [freshwater metagenome]|uniref:Unannotated protein n=1 Tax=freshwater metagenome TaxID=449393 RepID=A0A6J6LVW7_9ZZZZ